jgi:hypothetical protein
MQSTTKNGLIFAPVFSLAFLFASFSHPFKTFVMKIPDDDEELFAVKKKFPLQEERITKIFNSNEGFRQLSFDYFLCAKNVEKLRKEIDERKAWLLTYENVLIKLEKELIHAIFKTEVSISSRHI